MAAATTRPGSRAAQARACGPSDQRKATAGLLARGLGIGALVFLGVGRRAGRAIAHNDLFALEAPLAGSALLGGLGGGPQGALQGRSVQAAAGLAIGAVILTDLGAAQ